MTLDYYALLQVTQRASPADIKAAYHRALLAAHPDKNPSSAVDITVLQDAYRVLSAPALRAQHDLQLKNTKGPIGTGSRPAQIISLTEFQEDPACDAWSHPCRCGAQYTITVAEMDAGCHLVPCASCSEVIWVGYEMAEDADE
ncbi:hypothetical protein GGX14DRAFT_631890 [Mycena pura]|uniref:Diphthamide biosynthesis protein 3 n=1 Tax=Mycena pura TaxID=153505 RepID=A0AAD6YA83_9AGAR|nr:hypothetical protein GGX14DRAFT_631890 [Mycena pura]